MLKLLTVHSGYSKRSLIDKLGIKPNTTIVLLNQPQHYKTLLQPLPKGIDVKTNIIGLSIFTQFFTASKDALRTCFPSLTSSLSPSGTLWISWPKTTSRLVSDLNENIVRRIGLVNGLVDVKVIAADTDWSAA